MAEQETKETIKKRKVSELPKATSFKGLVTLGVDANNQSCQVELEAVGSAANDAHEKAALAQVAATEASHEAAAAREAREGIQEDLAGTVKNAKSNNFATQTLNGSLKFDNPTSPTQFADSDGIFLSVSSPAATDKIFSIGKESGRAIIKTGANSPLLHYTYQEGSSAPVGLYTIWDSGNLPSPATKEDIRTISSGYPTGASAGFLVKTKITTASLAMCTLTVTGNSYVATSRNYFSVIQFYSYTASQIPMTAVTHVGTPFDVQIFYYEGHVCLYLSNFAGPNSSINVTGTVTGGGSTQATLRGYEIVESISQASAIPDGATTITTPKGYWVAIQDDLARTLKNASANNYAQQELNGTLKFNGRSDDPTAASVFMYDRGGNIFLNINAGNSQFGRTDFETAIVSKAADLIHNRDGGGSFPIWDTYNLPRSTVNLIKTAVQPNYITTNIKPEVNTVRQNLGNPSLEEMAAVPQEFGSQFRFFKPSLQEESTNGVDWTNSTIMSDAQLKQLMTGGGNQTQANILPVTAVGQSRYYRLTWDYNDPASPGYVFLQALYLYVETANKVNIKIERKNDATGSWVEVASGNYVGQPLHVYLRHDTIRFTTWPAGSPDTSSSVRVTFGVENATTTNYSRLYSLEWLSGYPIRRHDYYTVDGDRNVTFPNNIVAGIGTAIIPSNSPIKGGDSILAAFNKAQGQINALSKKIDEGGGGGVGSSEMASEVISISSEEPPVELNPKGNTIYSFDGTSSTPIPVLFKSPTLGGYNKPGQHIIFEGAPDLQFNFQSDDMGNILHSENWDEPLGANVRSVRYDCIISYNSVFIEKKLYKSAYQY